MILFSLIFKQFMFKEMKLKISVVSLATNRDPPSPLRQFCL